MSESIASQARALPLLLFAKTPLAGKVKTRLQPPCTAEQAADIALILLEESIRKAISSWPGRILLCVWPDLHHESIATLANSYPIELVLQVEGNLGEKMHAAFERYGYPAAIMGCDAPHLNVEVLARAHQGLQDGHNVLAASEDGGYYLIGLSQPSATLFADIEWGTERVLNATLVQAQQHGIKFQQLEMLNDVDTWEDLIAAAEQLPNLQHYLRAAGLIAH